MGKLSKALFEKARNFMYDHGQDIDLAMFQCYFEENPKSEVIEVLGKYQNEDSIWSTSWRWGDPEIWQGVEKRLKGLITMNFLRSLDVFGRCEK